MNNVPVAPVQRAGHPKACPSRTAWAIGLRPATATSCCAPGCLPSPLPSAVPDPSPAAPLSGSELLEVLRRRWQASYDLQLVQRRGRLYLQVMWAYLEQQSFPLSAEAYGVKLEEVAGLLNGMGVAAQVRHWLSTTAEKPRLGKAMGLALDLPPERQGEYLL